MSVGFSFKVGGKFSVPTFTFSGKVGQTDTVPVHLLELLWGAGIMFDMTYTILYITKTNTIIIFSSAVFTSLQTLLQCRASRPEKTNDIFVARN